MSNTLKLNNGLGIIRRGDERAIYEKLDFLMNITNTSNALAQSNLDPSHISRLKGERSKDEAVPTAMADYFARHCTLTISVGSGG